MSRLAADSDPVASLTWGQRAIAQTVLAMGDDATYYTMTRRVRLAEPPRTSAVASALATMLVDHHSLRTVLRREGGDIVPCVLPDPALDVRSVPVAEAGDDDPAAVVAAAMKSEPIDVWHDPPIRAGLLTRGALATDVVLAVSHLAVDAAAMDIVEADLLRRLGQQGRKPPASWQPADQAAYEASPSALAASGRAVERWCRILTGSGLPEPGKGPSPGAGSRFQEWAIDSRAAADAACALAARAKVSPASAVLAIWCLALDAINKRENRAVITLISGNRRRERELSYVGPLAQDTLFSAQWPDGLGIEEFAGLVHREAMSAYSHGRYDPASLDTALGRGPGKVLTFFNDAQRPATTSAVRGMPAAKNCAEPVLRGQWPFLELSTFLVMQSGPGFLRLRMIVDTEALGEFSAPGILATLRRMLIEAANGAALPRLTAMTRLAGR